MKKKNKKASGFLRSHWHTVFCSVIILSNNSKLNVLVLLYLACVMNAENPIIANVLRPKQRSDTFYLPNQQQQETVNLINIHIWIVIYVSSSGSLALCYCESLNLKPMIMALLMKTSSKLTLPALSGHNYRRKCDAALFFSVMTKLQSSHGAAQLSVYCR